MNLLVSASILIVLSALMVAASEQQTDRQGKALSSSSNSPNSISLNGNTIEHSSIKARIDQERREIKEFMSAKNLIKSIITMLFGSQQEVRATSRSLLNVVSKALDLLKNAFSPKSRSSGARTFRESAEDVAAAGISMLQGYVKSVLTNDDACVQHYLCQASKEARNSQKETGALIATVGGYATSMMLNQTKSADMKLYNEAHSLGRANGDCSRFTCNETT